MKIFVLVLIALANYSVTLGQRFQDRGAQSFKLRSGGVRAYESLDLGSLGVLTVGDGYKTSSNPQMGCSQSIISLISQDLRNVVWSSFMELPNFNGNGFAGSVVKRVINASSYYPTEGNGVFDNGIQYVFVLGEVFITPTRNNLNTYLGCNTNVTSHSRPFAAKLMISSVGFQVIWLSQLDDPISHSTKEQAIDIAYSPSPSSDYVAIASLMVNGNDSPLSCITFLNASNGSVVSKQQVGSPADFFIVSKLAYLKLNKANVDLNTHLIVAGGILEYSEVSFRDVYHSTIGVLNVDSSVRELNPILELTYLTKSQRQGNRPDDGIVTQILKSKVGSNSLAISTMDWGVLQTFGPYNDLRRGAAVSYVFEGEVIQSQNGSMYVNLFTNPVTVHISAYSSYGLELIGRSLFETKSNLRVHFGTRRNSNEPFTGGTENSSLANFKGVYLHNLNGGGAAAFSSTSARVGFNNWTPVSMMERQSSTEVFSSLLTTGYANFFPQGLWEMIIECNTITMEDFIDGDEILPCSSIDKEPMLYINTLETSRKVLRLSRTFKSKRSLYLISDASLENGNTRCGCDLRSTEQVYSKKLTNEPINDNLHSKDGILIFPNPSDGILNMKLGAEGKWEVMVFSSELKLQFSEVVSVTSKHEAIELDLRNLSPGIYFVHLKNMQESYVNKVVIKHKETITN